MTIDWQEFRDRLVDAKSIILSTHKNPDGDGLGSEIAMFYYLKNINKDVRIINYSETPERYKFMDPNSSIETYTPEIHDKWISNADLVIVFDLGDYLRLCDLGDSIKNNNIDVINIDHHHTKDESMYQISIIDTKSPSTTYLIWKYFESIGLIDSKLEDEIALGLYVGLVNDTGSFRYNSVSSDTHKMAAHLFKSSINPNMVFQNIYENKSIEQTMLLSEMIRHIKFDCEGKIGYVTLNNDIFRITETSPYDADGFADYIRGIKGVEVSFCITSFSGYSKISFRSRGRYTVNDVAQKFGGGGHYYAAGCEVENDNVDQALISILKNFKEKIKSGN